jgi:hypothetical protein
MNEGKTFDELSDEVEAEDAAKALDRAWLDGGRTFADAFREALDERDKWVRGDKKPLPVPWPEWGAIVAGVPEDEPEKGGLLPGLHVVAAGTGVGKTQFAVSIAAHALEAGALVAYFALELSEQEVAVRAFAEAQGAPRWSSVLRGRDGESREVLEGIAETLTRPELAKRFGIFAPTMGGDFDLSAFVVNRAKAMRAKVNHEGSPFPPLLVFDYTQLAAVGGDFEARKAVTELAAALREASRAHDLVVIAISSVARSNYVNASKAGAEAGGLTPEGRIKNPEALLIAKESGEMEYCSNTSTVIVNVERLESGRALVALCVVKNREGFTRWAPAAFEGGRWQTPKRGGKVERSDVAAYFPKAEKRDANAADGENDMARKMWEGAWWSSGAEIFAGSPFVSHGNWTSYCVERRAKEDVINRLVNINLGGIEVSEKHSWNVRAVDTGSIATGGWAAGLLANKNSNSADGAAAPMTAKRPPKKSAGKKK